MDLNQELVAVGTFWCHPAIKEAVRIVRVVSEMHRHMSFRRSFAYIVTETHKTPHTN